MISALSALASRLRPRLLTMLLFSLAAFLMTPLSGFAQENTPAGGEANLILPDLSLGTFLGIDGRNLLMVGLAICALGLLFGLFTYRQLRDLPVHK